VAWRHPSPIHRAQLIALVLLAALSSCTKGQGPSSQANPYIAPGVAAFVYDYRTEWVAAIKAYNGAASKRADSHGRTLSYLLVGGGVLRINSRSIADFSFNYSTTLLKAYADDFPALSLIPIFGGRGGALLDSWGEADQRELGKRIAEAVAGDPLVPGILIDIEPMSLAHLPFYSELRKQLASNHQRLWLFAGDKEPALYKAVDVVVLSGYDIGGTPVTPDVYGKRLRSYIKGVFDALRGGPPSLLVAVPVAASAEEYETQFGSCSKVTGYSQEAWVSAALAALCPFRGEPAFVGLTLWGFYGDQLENPSGSGCFSSPGTISPANWQSVETFGDNCGH